MTSESLTPNECTALAYLHADGYTFRELERLFGVSHYAIANHLHRSCDCPEIDEPMEPPSFSAEELREWRYQNDILQTELADELDVTPSTVSLWESGRREPRLWRRYELQRAIDEL